MAKKVRISHVAVNSRSYGTRLKGMRVFYEGKKPKGLKPDGTFSFGKNILELLQSHYKGNFHLILTADTNAITVERNIPRVRISVRLLNRMIKELFARNRDIKNDIIESFFATVFPGEFSSRSHPNIYVPGSLARLLQPKIASKLSAEDKQAVEHFLPEFIASESVKSVNLLKAKAQIKSLKELADELEKAISDGRSESWWQTFIRDKILIIQQGYIKAIDKMNVNVGNTKFPDFSLVTHDSYLDILEIKKPDTNLLKLDSSRGNYHADLDLSRAIIQVENYISSISTHANDIRTFILDKYKMDLKVVRPRGIILAGNAQTLTEQKQRDDLRLISQGMKNISLVTYDELLARLRNYIQVLEEASKRG